MPTIRSADKRQMTDCPIPTAPEAEMTVLGAILQDGAVLEMVRGLLTSEDFFKTAHGEIYAACETVATERQEPVHLISVTQKLRRRDRLTEVGGSSYLASLMDAVPTAATVPYHARLVRQAAQARTLCDLGRQLTEAASRQDDVAQQIAEQIRAHVSEMRTGTAIASVVPISHAVTGLVNVLNADAPTFLSTPFPGLNRLLCGGLLPGELYYLAAKGGHGKTAFALELARHLSALTGVLVVSREMSVSALCRRLLAQESQVSASRLRQHTLIDADWPKISNAAGTLSDRRLWFVEYAPSVEAIDAALSQTVGVQLIVVDYLQLLRAKGEDRRAQIEAVSASLKALAMERQVSVLCLSAVSARGEGNRTPGMHWLRDSGRLEHDADGIWLLDQPDAAAPNRELIVAKARDAQCGTVHLTFAPDIVHFMEMETQRQEPVDRWER